MLAVDEKLIQQRSRKIACALTASCAWQDAIQFCETNFAPSLLRGENWSLGSVDQSGNTLKYDAWNRLISVTNSSGQVIAEYSYDARGYPENGWCFKEIGTGFVSNDDPQGGAGVPAGTTNYIYYDSNWQAIEVRTNGTAASDVTSQTVWSAAYVNAPVLQDSFSGGVIQPNSRIYFLHDANWNTTAVAGYNATTQTWGVIQRYIYSPYGSLIVLNADFSTPPVGTQPISDYLYQGMTLDAVTGLYYARNRNYSPSLGVWILQDPLQYVNGADRYQFVESSPVSGNDPLGLVTVKLSDGQMKELASDIANTLFTKDGGGGSFNGWSRAGAAAFVPYELRNHESLGLAGGIGKFLMTVPYKIFKLVVAPEFDILKEGGKIAAEQAKRAYEKWLNKAVKSGQIETFSFSWSSKAACGVSANMFFEYFPATHQFIGLISGRVGELHTIAGEPEVPPTFPAKSFAYPFSGKVDLYQGGLFDFYNWNLTTDGIVHATWRYDGNP